MNTHRHHNFLSRLQIGILQTVCLADAVNNGAHIFVIFRPAGSNIPHGVTAVHGYRARGVNFICCGYCAEHVTAV